MEKVPLAGDIEQSLLFSLEPATDVPVLWDFTHHRIDPLNPDQKAAVRAFLHWLYKRWLLEGSVLLDTGISLLAYWGYPEGFPPSASEQRDDALPPVIAGARL